MNLPPPRPPAPAPAPAPRRAGVRLTRWRAPALAAALVLLAGCAQTEPGPTEVERYSVRLKALNDSGVEGTANLMRAGPHLVIRIRATGMKPRQIHAQHLYSFASDDRDSRCPTGALTDGDENGLIDSEEGQGAYGRSILALEPYPTVDADGELDYVLKFDLDREKLDSLRGGALLLQGTDAGAYEFDLPAACGRLVRQVEKTADRRETAAAVTARGAP